MGLNKKTLHDFDFKIIQFYIDFKARKLDFILMKLGLIA